jgi:hypothetical protein
MVYLFVEFGWQPLLQIESTQTRSFRERLVPFEPVGDAVYEVVYDGFSRIYGGPEQKGGSGMTYIPRSMQAQKGHHLGLGENTWQASTATSTVLDTSSSNSSRRRRAACLLYLH